jgi:hypothetical protein
MTYELCSPAVHYHDQAQRIRSLAAEAHSLETRDQFLALAEQYERLAGQAARLPSPRPAA